MRCIFCKGKFAFQTVFLDSRWMVIKVVQRTILWLVVKRLFTSVWHVFVSRLVQSFWLLRSLWRLGSWWVCWLYHLLYQLIYTNLFGIQKMVSLQKVFYKDTKLPLPWPSRKGATFFISSNSNLVFFWLFQFFLQTLIHWSALFLFFERTWIIAFCTFSSRVSFLQCSAFCPHPCFCE